MTYWLVPILVGPVLLAAGAFLVLLRRESREPRLVCLMYHRLCAPEAYAHITGTERVFSLPLDAFEQQIAWLKRAGYAFVTAEQARRFATGEGTIPARSVLLTFDDGCCSVAEAAEPVLRRHGACATVFVTTDPAAYVFGPTDGNERRLTDEELRRLDGEVLRFESHGVTHRPMNELSDEDLEFELIGSKNELERVLGRRVEYLAIPGNWFDGRVMQFARRVGYKAVWCSNPGAVRIGSDVYGLPRINVEGGLKLSQFMTAVRPAGIAQRRLLSWMKGLPRRLLGPRVWLPIRKAILRCVPGGYLSVRRMATVAAAVAAIVIGVVVWLILSRS